jgi:hypothetical protein
MTAWQSVHRAVSEEGKGFFRRLDRPDQAQARVLRQILRSNRHSEFGRRYHFDAITSVDQYQASVPRQQYEQQAPDIARMAEGEHGILCAEAVTVFEQTGGSSSGRKLIPYTEAALHAFQQALYPWLYDLLSHRPGIGQGVAYWSISPAMRQPGTTAAGIRIGLANDAEYFGARLAADIGKLLAVPPSVGTVQDHACWQYLTLRYLLAAENLSLISVWSPTFLLDLIAALQLHCEQLADDISRGDISIDLTAGGKDQHPLLLQAAPHRAAQVAAACRGSAVDTTRLWPRLDTLSCWLDASAGRYRATLDALFPTVFVQGKGLLATEGVVSIPLVEANAAVLALNSGFYEFVDSDEGIHLAHELREGGVYRLILSNHSGLYRYELGDQVRVVGHLAATPLLEFLGRSGNVSDLCGEKLSEAFVQRQLGDADGFAMLFPCVSDRSAYRLVLDAAQYGEVEARRLATQLDQRLARNPQYAYARQIGQLAPVSALRVAAPWDRYVQYECKRQRRLGDIKPLALNQDAKLFAELTSASQTPENGVLNRC